MSSAPSAIELDPALAKDYPRPIREAYVAAVRKPHALERHQQLLRLGEQGIGYLASLAFADYRQVRREQPDPKVEDWIASRSRLTTGEYLRTFRLAQKASGHPEIFGIKRYEVNAKLAAASRLASAVGAVDYAQRVGATDVRMAIEEGLKSPQKHVRWLKFWDDFVEYRNRVIHAHDKGWPVDAGGYYELMTPLLEAALVEALTTEYIGHVLLEHPVARLQSVTRTGAEWNLALDGEYLGAPLIAGVRQAEPPLPWESEVGASYVLGRGADGQWRLWARFYDFKEEGVPASLGTTTPEPETAVRQAGAAESPEADGATGPGEVGTYPALPELNQSDQSLGDLARRAAAPAAPRVSPSVDKPPREDRERWYPSLSLWMSWGVFSFGFLAAVGFLWAATQARDARLRNWGLVYGALATTVLALAAIIGDEAEAYPVANAIAVTLLFGSWIASTVHALAVNSRVRRARAAGKRQ